MSGYTCVMFMKPDEKKAIINNAKNVVKNLDVEKTPIPELLQEISKLFLIPSKTYENYDEYRQQQYWDEIPEIWWVELKIQSRLWWVEVDEKIAAGRVMEEIVCLKGIYDEIENGYWKNHKESTLKKPIKLAQSRKSMEEQLNEKIRKPLKTIIVQVAELLNMNLLKEKEYN